MTHRGNFRSFAFFMRLAVRKARQGIQNGQTPFGACIVKKGKPVSLAHNQVWRSGDITAHAEIVAIRQACRKLKTIDLSGCVIYSTCEPCPMCFAACHWARLSKIVYGVKIGDARRIGFNEFALSNQRLKRLGKSRIKLEAGVLREENLELFKLWFRRKGKRAY